MSFMSYEYRIFLLSEYSMIVSYSKTLLLCTLMSVGVALQAADGLVTITSVDQYSNHVHGSKPVIVMFTASWCGPCKATKPHFIELAKTYTDLTFCMIDTDNKDLASLTGEIKGVPTFVGFHKGRELFRNPGGKSRAQLQDMIETFKAEVTGQKKASVKAPELSSDDYFKKGQEHYKKIVGICSKKEFDGEALEAVMVDETSMQLYQRISSGDPASDAYKRAFEDMKTYMRGAKKALDSYKFQQKNPQDAVIRYNQNFIDMTIAAPDFATYMSRSMKISEALQKKMKALTWELLADIDFANL